jgi:HAD domain in Swiss Army Knife RNA repair proteins
MRAKEHLCDSSSALPEGERPLLMVDIDGVISLFGGGLGGQAGNGIGGTARARPDGIFSAIDGIPHFLSSAAATHLLSLAEAYALVWCSGWEEKAEEYLPRLLGLPAGLPFLRFERMTGSPPARAGRSIDGHWKLDAIGAYAGERALAWIDDAFDGSCHAWAAKRPAPTLLVETDPSLGLTSKEAQLLAEWALAPTRPQAGAPS